MELIKYKYVVSGKPFLDAKKKTHFFNGIPVCKRCLNQADSTWDLRPGSGSAKICRSTDPGSKGQKIFCSQNLNLNC